MTIELNYNQLVDVQRMGPGLGDVEQYIAHLNDVECHIQPLDDTYSEDLDGSFGKEWLMYCDFLDILEGDRVINGAINYKVVAVKKFHFLDLERHMEIRIREYNP